MQAKDGLRAFGGAALALCFMAAASYAPEDNINSETQRLEREQRYINHLLETDPNCRPSGRGDASILDCTPKE